MDIRPQANSLWAEEDKSSVASTHLALARCQNMKIGILGFFILIIHKFDSTSHRIYRFILTLFSQGEIIMKNKLYIFITLTILIFIFCSCVSGEINKVEEESSSSQIAEIEQPIAIPESVDTIPVTRATVAKMLALAFNDRNTIQTTETEINFKDVAEDKWYSPYINISVIQGYMSGFGDTFSPDGPLTINEAQLLLDKLNPQNRTKIKITDDIKDKPISYALWTELYIKMLEDLSEDKSLSPYSIKLENIIVLTTPANNPEQKIWTMTTDKGEYGFAGLNVDPYIDCEIKAYTKGNEIVAFLNVEKTDPTITNAYLMEASTDFVRIFVGGAERIYKLENIALPSSDTQIVDIKINQGKLLEIKPITEKMNGRFMRADSNYIELAQIGKKETYEDMKTYSNIDGNVEWKSLKSIVSGSDIAEYILKDGKICAAIINKDLTPQNIRVAISTTNFQSLVHQSIKLTSSTDYRVADANGVKHYKKGDIFEVNADMFNNCDRIYIKSESENGKIELQSITRGNAQTPKYRGIIEIAQQDNGYSIVNDINLEQYLYAVVPSEMPSSYGLEALKVQAITARSYAYNQIFSNKYYRYGANVDDSTQSQVYNNTTESEISTQAVDATAKQVLTYNDAVISANFFSTSSGSTANSGDVWINTSTNQFPADTPVYLTSVKQYQENDFGDLSDEKNAELFFKNMKVDSYDSNSSWFRWYVTMSVEELSASINTNLKDRYNANKAAIKTKLGDNIYRSRDIETIGTLTDMQVIKRGEGGNIMELLLVGTDATVKVQTEYNIRILLKPFKYLENGKDIILYRKNGSKLSNYSLLPSAFITFDKNLDANGKLQSVTIYGGGNGHGVGMSQNGVKTMADKGYSCEEILSHYYKDTQVQTIE